MNRGENKSGNEVSGLNTNDVIVIMTLTTLFSPILIISTTLSSGDSPTTIGFWIMAPIWTYGPEWFFYSPGFRILLPLFDPMILIFSIIPFLFAIQVVRYCQEKTSLWKTMSIGVSYFIVLFLILFANSTLYILSEGMLSYSGPIPIQLIVGYIIARRFSSKFARDVWGT